LSIATGAVILAVLLLPFTPFAALLGFTRLPAIFYGWMLLLITGYILMAEVAKKWFYRRVDRVG